MSSLIPAHIRGISLDFANTIYPLRKLELGSTIAHLHRFLEGRLDRTLPASTLYDLYVEIRDRQFAENRETLRENDFPARLREMIERVEHDPDDELIQGASDAYAAGFIQAMRIPDGAAEAIRSLFERFEGNVVVCSNFIRRDCIVEPLRRDGILRCLKGVVVSCDVGFVKPHPLVFQAVCETLELAPSEILHVGDDLDADISGGRSAGMLTAYSREWCDPVEESIVAEFAPDIVVSRLSEL